MKMNSRNRISAAAIILGGLAACSSPYKIEVPESQALPNERGAFAVSRSLPRAGEGRLTAELERRIQLLIADFTKNGPATVDNASARAMTLYDWGNAMKLEGQWVHPDLPALTTITQQPDFKTSNPRVLAGYLAGIDNFTRDFMLRRAQPDAFGEISMRVLKPAIVNDFHSVEMTYTVGTEPIRKGGGIIVPNHMRFADFEYQTSDPTKPNYVTIRSSNDSVVFTTGAYPASGQYSTSLGAAGALRLAFFLSEGQLTEGDTVTVTFGDTSGGSPGLQTVHYSNSALRYPVWVATGPAEEGGVLHSLPELPVEVLGGPASGVQGFAPAMAEIGEEIEVTIRTEDRFRNRAETDIPQSYEIVLNGVVLKTVQTEGKPLVRVPISFSEEGVHRLSYRSADGAISGTSSPILVEKDLEQRVYWGETHGHSGWAEGLGLVDNYFEFAREESRLDFVTLSEHDLWMDLSEWSEMREAVEAHFRDGQFITFMGYEWTSLPQFGGHHNVLFRDPETAILAGTQYYPELNQLYAGLRGGIPEEDVVVVPHAHQPGDWTKSDPGLERLVEIVSYHGTFEWFGRRYLDQGWEVGFIGSSDDHVGSPGYRPRAFGSPGSDNFGGLAAVYASELSRDSVFDALRNRQAYATNGARIILTARLNGQEMGTRLPSASPTRTLSGKVVGTAPIASLTLLKNGEELETLDFSADHAGSTLEIAFQFDSQPLTRRASYPDPTFIGTVQVSGGDLESVKAPVAEALNSETEFAKLRQDDIIDYSLRSGGRHNTIELEMAAEPDPAATLTIEMAASKLAEFDASTLEPLVFSMAELTGPGVTRVIDPKNGLYSITVRRVSKPVIEDRSFKFIDASPAEEGDYYFLRVRQSDGGMAWTSPWWIGAPSKRARE